MTISIAWVREKQGANELIFASDSRLTGGGHVDCCQKVFPLPREDCGIAFCGQSFLAYPFIFQLTSFIADYKKGNDRAVDLSQMQNRISTLLNSFLDSHENQVPQSFADDLRQTQFLFGGWSWKHSKFFIYRLYFERGDQRFHFANTGIWRRYELPRGSPLKLAFIGDYAAEFLFLVRFDEKVKERRILQSKKLDFEPLEVLTSMLEDDKFTDRNGALKGVIGGPPQVMKIYPFMRTVNFGIYWNVGNVRKVTSRGRVLGEYELTLLPILDPKTLETTLPLANIEN
jgi:hypothetical protein